jgi:hypothetical protein
MGNARQADGAVSLLQRFSATRRQDIPGGLSKLEGKNPKVK